MLRLRLHIEPPPLSLLPHFPPPPPVQTENATGLIGPLKCQRDRRLTDCKSLPSAPTASSLQHLIGGVGGGSFTSDEFVLTSSSKTRQRVVSVRRWSASGRAWGLLSTLSNEKDFLSANASTQATARRPCTQHDRDSLQNSPWVFFTLKMNQRENVSSQTPPCSTLSEPQRRHAAP